MKSDFCKKCGASLAGLDPCELCPACEPKVIVMTAQKLIAEAHKTFHELVGPEELVRFQHLPEEDFDPSAQMRRIAAARDEAREVARWAQALLTALNVGDVKSGSPLHLKLREVMIAYRGESSM